MNTSRAFIAKQILFRQLPAQTAVPKCMSNWVPVEKETHTGQVPTKQNQHEGYLF